MIIDPKAEAYAARYSEAESPLLRELREMTSRELKYNNMLSGPVVGALLQSLVMVSGARNVLEVGMFTGYGTLWMAMGLPADGRITTCESNEKYEQIGRRFFDRFRLALYNRICFATGLRDKLTIGIPNGFTIFRSDLP